MSTTAWGARRAAGAAPRHGHPTHTPSVPDVTRPAAAPMEAVDAQPTLRDLATAARVDVAHGGSGRAAETLMGRVRQLVLRYARVRLGRFGAEDVAQDVAQEVCMAVFSALPTYDERGLPFEAFVYSIAGRKLADAQRSLMRGPTTVDAVPEQTDESTGPEDAAVVRDEAARAMRLVATLPEVQREIVTMRVAVGMSTAETAAALGMTEGAVRVAQHRALTKLREQLARTGDREPADELGGRAS